MEHTQHTPLSSFRTTFKSGKFVWLFIGISTIITVIIVYFGISKTTITIERATFPIRSVFIFTVSENPAEDEIEGTYAIETLSHTTTYSGLEATSSIEGTAEGTIRVINNWNQEQPLQATTRFLTEDGVLFRTTERVDVPAGGEALVPVRADEEGSQGDVVKGTSFTIPGLWAGLQESIYGVAENDFSGGKVSAAIVSQKNIDEAQEQTLKELDALAVSTYKTESDQDTYTRVIRSDILLNQASAQVGQTADELTYTVRARYVIISIPEKDLRKLYLEKMTTQLTDDEEIISFKSEAEEMSIERISSDTSSINLKASVTGEAQLISSSPLLAPDQFTNKNESALNNFAEEEIGIKSITATFSPFWVTSTPGTASRINVIVE